MKKSNIIPSKKQQIPDEDLLVAFAQSQNNNEIAEVLKELFNTDKIHLITELTRDEIKLITRIKMIAELKRMDVYNKGLDLYMKLLISHKRKSRREIIEAIGRFPSMMGGMAGRFGNMFNKNRF